MSINATLLGQMITFAVFVWFTMKFVWPALAQSLEERKKKIADGLAAAEKGHKTLEKSQDEARHLIQQAREKSAEIVAQANSQAQQILDEAKEGALKERQDIVDAGHQEVQQAVNLAKTQLQTSVADVVLKGAEQILKRSIKADDHKVLLDELSQELG